MSFIVKSLCSSYALEKCSKLAFVSTASITCKPLQLMHIDVWGPAPIRSVYGYRYYIIFIDDYTKYSSFFPLKCKLEVFTTFVHFKNVVEKYDE